MAGYAILNSIQGGYVTLRTEVIRAKDGLKKIRIDENQTQDNLGSDVEIFTKFYKGGAFKAFAIYNNDTNECLYKQGNI